MTTTTTTTKEEEEGGERTEEAAGVRRRRPPPRLLEIWWGRHRARVEAEVPRLQSLPAEVVSPWFGDMQGRPEKREQVGGPSGGSAVGTPRQ